MAKRKTSRTSSRKSKTAAKPKRSPKSHGLKSSDSPVVGILTGSPNDLPTVLKARDVFRDLDIPCDVRVLSAHRTPDDTVEYVGKAQERGFKVLICCAGMAAHLAGVAAAHTTLPVIGVPLAAGALSGFDALLSTVQMPPGVPVATVGVDNARNAAFLAARILAATHPELRSRLLAQQSASKKRYDAPNPKKKAQADKL